MGSPSLYATASLFHAPTSPESSVHPSKMQLEAVASAAAASVDIGTEGRVALRSSSATSVYSTCFATSSTSLVCWAKLRTGLYILYALISFFSSSSSFLMISRRQIISGSAGPIFAIFSPNKSVLGADDRSGPFFQYLKGRCHGNRFCEKMANSALSSLWHSETEWDNAVYMHDLIAPLMSLSCKIW